MAERIETWAVTLYCSDDNDPPGYDIAYPNERHTPGARKGSSPCWGVGYEGEGTYAYPIPCAADPKVLKPGTLIYDPLTERYYEMVDLCAECVRATKRKTLRRLDLYAGGDLDPTPEKRAKLNAAMNRYTSLKGRSIIVDPAPGKFVPVLGPVSGVASGCDRRFGPARRA